MKLHVNWKQLGKALWAAIKPELKVNPQRKTSSVPLA